VSLRFILDGYNIIKSESTNLFRGMTLETQRNRLLELIRTAQPQGSSRNLVTIVFDSASSALAYESSASMHSSHGIEVVFSGGRSADDYIEELVRRSPHPADLVIVSDDKGLRRRVGGRGVRCMPVQEFLARLDRDEGKRGSESGSDDGEINKVNEELRRTWLPEDKDKGSR